MDYIVFLDEFGHIGPYISRKDKKHYTSPVFGLAGIVLPIENVREFSSWFFGFKNKIFAKTIKNSNIYRPLWEKKGTKLYTTYNIENKSRFIKYITERILYKLEELDGYVFYVGEEKIYPPDKHNPLLQYKRVLLEAIKRLDQFCDDKSTDDEFCRFLLVLDQNTMRQNLISSAAIAMYNADDPRNHLIEQPFEVESNRYQNMQVADWIAALVGRLGAYWKKPDEYQDYAEFSYFSQRLKKISISGRCGIR